MNENLIDKLKTLPNALTMIEQLRGGLIHRCRREELRNIVDALISGVPVMYYPVNQEFLLFRGRIENDIILNSPGEFSYCPIEYSKSYGRCHKPNTTIFYGANNLNTVLSELSPEIGDTVFVGVAKVKKSHNIRFTSIGELDYQRRFTTALYGGDHTSQSMYDAMRDINDQMRIRALLVDAFLAEQFSMKASKSNEYKLTSTLIEILLSPNRFAGEPMDGVIYPSVAHRGGNNYVVLPNSFDDKFEWDYFKSIEIVDDIGYGLFTTFEIATGYLDKYQQIIKWKWN